MRSQSIRTLILASVASLSVLGAGCSDMARQGTGSYTLVIDSLTGNGSGTLQSDVVATSGTIFNDNGEVSLRLIAKNPVGPAPTDINSVTISRYRVTFRRSDGRNGSACDVPRPRPEDIAVPCPFDSAITVRVPVGNSVTSGFELIRHTAKQEAPLAALAQSAVILSTIADVTFFGRDQAGNEVAATGSIGVQFGNFGDEL